MPRPASPTSLRVVALIAGACLVAAVVAVVAGTGSSSKSHTIASGGSSGTSPSSTLAPGSPLAGATTTAAPAGHTATTRGSGTTGSGGKPTVAPATTSAPGTTVAPLTTAPGPAGDPGQPTATAPGAYHYAFSGSSSQGAESGTITETIATQASSGGVTRQSVVDSGGPQGTSTNEVVSWGAPGERLLSQSFVFGGSSATCTWNPPLELLPGALAKGTTWSFKSTCHTTFSGQPLTLNLTGNATVTGKQRLEVGGQPVDVWTLSDSYDVSGTYGAVAFTDHHAATDQVAARLGLLVEEDATDTTSGGGRSGSATTHRALQKLTPS